MPAMRVVLIRPRAECSTYDPEVQEPLGIEALAATLRTEGYQVLLLDAMLDATTERSIAAQAASAAPSLVGFSLMSDADAPSAARMMQWISNSTRAVHFVAGGGFVSTEPDRAARLLPSGTTLIRYEGEIPLLALASAIQRCVPWVPCSMPVVSPDSLPDPSRDLLPRSLARSGVANMQGSRGCTGHCTFCVAPSLPHPPGRPWRGRSAERIADELQILWRDFGVAAVNFVDDDFLGPPCGAEARAVGLRNAIRARGVDVRFGAQLRPEGLHETVVDAMVQAGLAFAFVGLESENRAVLREWGRPMNPAAAWRAIDMLRAKGVEVSCGAIPFGAGGELRATDPLLVGLRNRGLLNYRTATNRLHLLPGSALHTRYIREGLIPVDHRGPFAPPLCPRMEAAYRALLASLAPLRAVWVEAAAALPGLACRARVDPAYSSQLDATKAALKLLDDVVAHALPTLLNLVNTRGLSPTVQSTRLRSRAAAGEALSLLQQVGVPRDASQLRQAMELEGLDDPFAR